MPTPFISTQDLSDYLGVVATADAGATICIDAACDICRDVAEITFNESMGTATLDGTGTDVLLLPEHPVTNVGTVNLMTTGTTESVTEFEWTRDGRLLRGSAGSDPRPAWPRGRQNVQVVYDYGYGTADLPRSVRMVALGLASRLIVQGVAKRETVGDVQVEYAGAASDLTANELRILQRYRQRRSF